MKKASESPFAVNYNNSYKLFVYKQNWLKVLNTQELQYKASGSDEIE